MLFLLALLLALPFTAHALDQTSADALAQSILTASGRHCAVIAVPRCGSGELVVSFWNKAGNSHLIVDGFESDPTLLASAQQKANALGLLGRNLYVRSGTLSTNAYSMPYADHFVDLVAVTGLADADLAGISYAEMERVLCTGGQAWVGRAAAEGAGLSAATLNTWISGTHALSTATVVSDATGTWAVITKISRLPNTYEGGGSVTNAGSRFFNDQVATWPTLPQWAGKPYGGTGGKRFNWGILAKICVGGGRMYGFDDNNPNALCALRAQSGVLLWQRAGLDMSSNGGIQAFSKGVVYDNQIIDGETGVTTGTIPLPTDWTTGTRSYQVDKDILYAVASGTGGINTLFAYDLVNRVTVYSQANFADNKAISSYYTGWMLGSLPSVVMAGGKLYASSGSSVYCYNTSDGSKNWGPATAPISIGLLEASPNGVLLQTAMDYTLKTVNLCFLAVSDGSLKWGPKSVSSPHGYCDISQISSLNGGNEAICTQGNGGALDLLTGTSCGAVGWYGGGDCAPGASMSPAGFFSRRDGITYSMPLRATNVNSSDPYASDCTDSPFSASGLIIYKDKWCNCGCYGLFRGTTAQAPLGAFNPEQAAVQSERLQQGPAYGNVSMQVVPNALDWSTHRANINRSGYVPVPVVTNTCVQLWKYTNPTPNAYDKDVNDDFYTYQDVTPPVTAGAYTVGSYTYLAGSDGVVKCLDNTSGNLVWSYPTGAWIFATPTVANGCVYVGSGDGYAYCLEAHTGRLVWRFRAAPAERRFNYYGHLISTWPIMTGVLVHPNGNAYFASGMMDEYGVQVYAVNALTGAIVWQNTGAGICLDNRPGLARVGHMPGGYITALGNKLLVKEGTHAYSLAPQRIDVYDLQTGVISGQDTSFPKASENSYAFWSGRQIGLMGNYVIGWGEDIHTEMEIEQYGGATTFSKMDASGNPVRPFLELPNNTTRVLTNMNALVWDDTEAYLDAYKYELSGITGMKQYLDNCVANPPPTTADPTKLCSKCYTISKPAQTTDPLWKPVSVGGVNAGSALTTNCLVELSGSGDIGVMNRVTGAQLFHVSSGGEPYLQGLAVDRSGKIIVVNRNGDVVCYGTPAPVVVTPPADMAGLDAGKPVTFSVEAAGPGLSYQWRHNGVNIGGATGATYTITSTADTDAGSYDVVVTNANGSVTSNGAVLSLAVAARITAPADGAVFSQPADAQSPSITLSATATSLHGAITKVEFYVSGTTLLGTSTTAPYSFTWSNAAPGTSTVTCKAYDDQGAKGTSQPVNITVAALVVHYPFNETSGTTSANTAISGSYNGTLFNGPVWTTQSIFNGGLHFNDNVSRKQTVTLGPVSALSNSAFTAGYWVNYDSTGLYGRMSLYCKDPNTSGTCHSYVGETAGNPARPQLTWFTVSGTKLSSTQYHANVPGVWYHYAVVATPAEVDWYVNGVLLAAIAAPGGQTMMTSYQSFGVGGKTPATANASFLGIMDEVKFYDRALSAADIKAMYDTNIPFRIAPTISLTSPTDGTVITATNSLSFSVATSGSHFPLMVNYYANGSLIGSGTAAPYSFTWNNVARGSYALTAQVVDGLGQAVTSNTANVTFTYEAQPVLNLAGGTYMTAQNVMITCADPSAVIHYTTNGADPTESDPVVAVSGSILVDHTLMLKVRAFKSGIYPSEIQAVIYRIGGAVAAGYYHSLIQNSGAPLWACGYNYFGGLGDGTTTQRNSPVCVSNLTNMVSIAAGGYHSLAVKSDGTAWAWGYNYNGQLGDGTTTQRNSPVQVKNLTGMLSTSAGNSHSLAVKSDGTAWAWGLNSSGQLGTGGTTQSTTPVQVGGTAAALTNVIAVAAGASHSLALKRDGTVWAWGAGTSGQLGNNLAADSLLPVQAQVTGTVVAIAAGGSQSLALKSDGTVWAWGANDSGQLGDNSMIQRNTPVQASGLTGVATIAEGDSHSLALKSDGTVWAWGDNSQNQLGDGTTTQRNTPGKVNGLSNMSAIAAGQSNSLALGADGSLWGWGANWSGALGSGTTTPLTVPTATMSASSPVVTFTSGSQSKSEAGGPIAITAQLFAPAAVAVSVPFTMTGTAKSGTDYTIVASPITIPAGQTSGTITITPINDTVYRGSRTIIVTMGAPTNAAKGITTVHTVTLTDDDPMPSVSFTSASQSKCENAGTATIIAQLSAVSGSSATVPFTCAGTAVSGTDYTISGTSVTIAVGQTSGTISVTLINVPGYHGDRTVIVAMGTPTNATLGSTITHTLTITDADPKPISITTQVADQSVPWGQPATFSVLADGSSPTYRWSKNGTLITGATNASYTTPATVLTDNGAVFSVVAWNVVSSGTSSGTLTVVCNPPPAVNIFSPADRAVLPTGNLQIKVNTASSALAKVEFFQGTTKLGETGGDPFTWMNVPAGQYVLTAKATDNQGQTTTSTPVSVTVNAEGYAAWVAAHGLTDADALETAKPAKDGIDNLVKYALGLCPTTPCNTVTDGTNPGLPQVTAIGATLSITYQKDTTKTDIVYTVETSTDLATWSNDGITDETVSTNGTVQTIKSSIPRSSGRMFMRLRVTK